MNQRGRPWSVASTLLALDNEAAVVTGQTLQSDYTTYMCAHRKPCMVMSYTARSTMEVNSKSLCTGFNWLKTWSNNLSKKKNLLKMYLPSGQPKYCWVCFYIGTDLERLSITSHARQWILCTEWVASELEFKQLIKTSKWSTSNSHDSSLSVNVMWSEKLFVSEANPLTHF